MKTIIAGLSDVDNARQDLTANCIVNLKQKGTLAGGSGIDP